MYVFLNIIAVSLYSLLFFVAGAYYTGGLYPGGYHSSGQEIETLQQENADLKKHTTALIASMRARCGVIGEIFPQQSMGEAPALSIQNELCEFTRRQIPCFAIAVDRNFLTTPVSAASAEKR